MADDIIRPERSVEGQSGITTPFVPAKYRGQVSAFADLIPDYDTLREARLRTWVDEIAQFALNRDNEYPLWSLTHRCMRRWRAQGDNAPISWRDWRVDLDAVRSFYVYYQMSLVNIAAHAGISLSSLEVSKFKLQWDQAKRTSDLLVEQGQAIAKLSDVVEETRRQVIGETMTNWGYEVGRHAMAALLNDPTQMTQRDAAALLQMAMRLIGMGEKMPTDFRHSIVENDANAQTPIVNILNLPPDKTKALFDELAARAALLQSAGALALPEPEKE